MISHLHIYHPGTVDVEQPADLVRLMVHVRVRALDGRLTSIRRNYHGKLPVINTNYRSKTTFSGKRHSWMWRGTSPCGVETSCGDKGDVYGGIKVYVMTL